jgi:hypothetical protein
MRALVVWLAFSVAAVPAPALLSFRELLERSARGLRPSTRLLALDGQRVRLVGYMAQMEEPPKGGFYLCPAPVLATEGGGGTADLPPDAVLVIVKAARGRHLAHISRPVEVTGILQVGTEVDDEGHVSNIRIVLDGPAPPSRTRVRRHS